MNIQNSINHPKNNMESTDSSVESQRPHLPPGFRFHPTDEELVVHYLKKKVASAPLPASIIAEVDLYKFDPWELPGKAIFGEQEWYFFSPRDRKYPNGARPNRAATSGFWKATGTDKPVLTSGGTHRVGVKKALVFYGGKPPKGIKTNWIMHEYRITDNKSQANKPPPGYVDGTTKGSLRLDDWVLCRIYKKNTAQRQLDLEMIGSIEAPKPSSNYVSFLENERELYDHRRMSMSNDLEPLQFPFAGHNLHLPGKRTLPNLYNWNEEGGKGSANSPSTKRFVTDNCEPGSNSFTNIHGQLPRQTEPSLEQQGMIENHDIGDGVFRHPSYQVSGMSNWYT